MLIIWQVQFTPYPASKFKSYQTDPKNILKQNGHCDQTYKIWPLSQNLGNFLPTATLES